MKSIFKFLQFNKSQSTDEESLIQERQALLSNHNTSIQSESLTQHPPVENVASNHLTSSLTFLERSSSKMQAFYNSGIYVSMLFYLMVAGSIALTVWVKKYYNYLNGELTNQLATFNTSWTLTELSCSLTCYDLFGPLSYFFYWPYLYEQCVTTLNPAFCGDSPMVVAPCSNIATQACEIYVTSETKIDHFHALYISLIFFSLIIFLAATGCVIALSYLKKKTSERSGDIEHSFTDDDRAQLLEQCLKHAIPITHKESVTTLVQKLKDKNEELKEDKAKNHRHQNNLFTPSFSNSSSSSSTSSSRLTT